ncbi:MAG: hypothetical protein CR981_03585 [Proteobacteria bacterium]|nr:MAG: hypothetical protein CR981_03585 [Pseudomonadota bacterium]
MGMNWSYKTVHFELKKEGLLGSGVLDESEMEQELNEFGCNGWELISVLEVQDGVIAFFKQPFGMKSALNNEVKERNVVEKRVTAEEPPPVAVVTRKLPSVVEDETVDIKEQEKDDLLNNGMGAIRIE